MAETKKSFLIYFDAYPVVSGLPPEQRGELFSALCEYAQAEAERPTEQSAVLSMHPAMSTETRMAFCFMAQNIQRDTEKWRQKHVRYQQAALRRQQDARAEKESMAQYVQRLAGAPENRKDLRPSDMGPSCSPAWPSA
ncbi:MAG: DUF6291 domain-containing protein [Oscillospiraceae bacterium]|nr:DUF6291 domain-containing protein [Oscillospiraceae bacterium]